MFKDFLLFLIPAELSLSQLDTLQLLFFMEFLCQNGLSPSNIANYLAAIRANFIICGLPIHFMQDDRIHLFLIAIKINRPLALENQSVFSDSMLQNIIEACSHLQHTCVFIALYTFLLSSFFGLSNVLLHTTQSFDPSHQLCRLSTSTATILLKWSKTNQEREQIHTLAIPNFSNSTVCPTGRYKTSLSFCKPILMTLYSLYSINIIKYFP